jgi:hypothetical protein
MFLSTRKLSNFYLKKCYCFHFTSRTFQSSSKHKLASGKNSNTPTKFQIIKKQPKTSSELNVQGGGRGVIPLREALNDPFNVAVPDADNFVPLMDFTLPTTIDQFLLGCDQDIGGESTISLEYKEETNDDNGMPTWADDTDISGTAVAAGLGYARFSGNLSMDFTGDATRSGYAMTRSKEPVTPLDLGEFEGLAMRVRSPMKYQRPYQCNVRTTSFLPDEVYIGILQNETPGWVTVQLPFDSFVLTGRGHFRAIQRPMNTHEILTFGFSCSEKVPGPYVLDIAWIAAVRNMLEDKDILKLNYNDGILDAAAGIIR